jgi:TRAP transporter 4TM/12TM fusion protein
MAEISAEEKEKLLSEEQEEKQRYRVLKGPVRLYQKVLGILIPIIGIVFILNLPLYFGISLFNQQFLGLFLGLLMALMFIILPPSPKSSRRSLPWYDLIFSLLSLFTGFYIFICYPDLISTIGVITPFRVFIGTIVISLVIEGTRRTSGWILVAVVLFFIVYFKFGYLFSGILEIQKISWERMVTQLFLGADSIYGVALRTAAIIVFGFILFAQFMFGTGGAKFLFGLAEAAMGRYRGGPAKAGVLASAFFGMLSGSAVANVAATGTLTIPMMKDIGYKPHFAAGVSAVASTGGVITPPIMGAAAFIISEFLGVPYAEVLFVAIAPAALYYLSLFMQVDLRAAKDGLKGMPPAQVPSLIQVMKEGWFFLIPIAVLIFVIFFLHLRPESAALYSLLSLLIIGLIKKDIRAKLKGFVTFFENTSRSMLEVSIICGAAGLVIGVITYSGLGLTLSRILTETAGNNLLLLTLMTAAASIILGMGMPATAAYLLLALLVAPALIDMGVQPLIAHLFIFYFGCFSFITPPVCLAAYAAASIAGADLLKTAWQSILLAIPAFIVPFLFIFNPAVALQGTGAEIIRELFFAVIAVFAICIAIEGFFRKEKGIVTRTLFGIISVCLFLPLPPTTSFIAVAAFLILLIITDYLPAGKPMEAIKKNT